MMEGELLGIVGVLHLLGVVTVGCGLFSVEKHSDTMGGLRAFDRGLCLLVLYHFCTDVVPGL
jgi:hypothetical protein